MLALPRPQAAAVLPLLWWKWWGGGGEKKGEDCGSGEEKDTAEFKALLGGRGCSSALIFWNAPTNSNLGKGNPPQIYGAVRCQLPN